MGFGTRTIATGGREIRVSSDGRPEWKAGGVTIDWSLVTAVNVDTTLPDGTIILTGDKYLRYGQVLTQKTQAEVQTIDLSGGNDPTGGTWTITVVTASGTGTTSALAYNASAATVQAALEALANIGADNVTVGLTGFVYTLTFSPYLGNLAAVTVDSTSLTGSGLTITIGTSTQGLALGGYWGPYDANATDGRQTLTRGRCFILDHTIIHSQMHSDQISPIEGGRVWLPRIIDIVGNPSESNLIAAFPGCFFDRG